MFSRIIICLIISKILSKFAIELFSIARVCRMIKYPKWTLFPIVSTSICWSFLCGSEIIDRQNATNPLIPRAEGQSIYSQVVLRKNLRHPRARGKPHIYSLGECHRWELCREVVICLLTGPLSIEGTALDMMLGPEAHHQRWNRSYARQRYVGSISSWTWW